MGASTEATFAFSCSISRLISQQQHLLSFKDVFYISFKLLISLIRLLIFFSSTSFDTITRAPSTWNEQTLRDLGMLPLYLTSNFYVNFDKVSKTAENVAVSICPCGLYGFCNVVAVLFL